MPSADTFTEQTTLLRKWRHTARGEALIRSLLAQQSSADASRLLLAALWHPDGNDADSGYTPSAYEYILHRDLLLAGRCMSDECSLEPDLVRQIIRALIDLYFQQGGHRVFASVARPVIELFRVYAATEGDLRRAILYEMLLEQLQTGVSHYILEAASLLRELDMPTEEVIPPLLHLLETGNPWEKTDVAEELLKRNREVAAVQEAMLGVLRLARSDYVTSTSRVHRSYESAGYNITRRNSVDLLMESGVDSGSIIEILRPELESEDIDQISAALFLLEDYVAGNPEIAVLLQRFLDHPHPRVVLQVADSLGKLDEYQELVAAALLRLLLSGKLYPREEHETTDDTDAIDHIVTFTQVIGALTKLGRYQEAVADMLLRMLTSPDANIRTVAVECFGIMGVTREPVIQALTECLDDRYQQVARSAAGTVEKLGVVNEEVVAGLLRQLSRPRGIGNNTVIVAAARALVTFGLHKEEVSTALLALSRNAIPSMTSWNAMTLLNHLGVHPQEATEEKAKWLHKSDYFTATTAKSFFARQEFSYITTEVIASTAKSTTGVGGFWDTLALMVQWAEAHGVPLPDDAFSPPSVEEQQSPGSDDEPEAL